MLGFFKFFSKLNLIYIYNSKFKKNYFISLERIFLIGSLLFSFFPTKFLPSELLDFPINYENTSLLIWTEGSLSLKSNGGTCWEPFCTIKWLYGDWASGIHVFRHALLTWWYNKYAWTVILKAIKFSSWGNYFITSKAFCMHARRPWLLSSARSECLWIFKPGDNHECGVDIVCRSELLILGQVQ